MPQRPLRPCRKVGCPNLTRDETGYCEFHKREYLDYLKRLKAERDRRYDERVRKIRDKQYYEFYKSEEWERSKTQALIRDKVLCQWCLRKGIIRPADVVHHIVPIKEDWSKRFDLDNLVSLCHECHNKYHSKG
ncbi:HNH endonuclease [Caldanaerobacter subterraneus]|uniref:Putative HNH nuclease YajD n=1 Tax=Caldanaerobacter subterraneus TaxID=911092 RepID=A0A7Y2L7N8_9THEO|nr:HNH endonuclease [Caldanaerobacter subterraneus]NNG67333.1 HNH endonuclease [Caldanaerobacter subterraneus]